jgi:uncharacterized membrane protein YdjX (TVP38/TMEM64 family)
MDFMQQAISPTQDHERGTPKQTVWLWWASVAALVVGVLLWMSVLPMQEVGERLGGWVSGLGVWGPVVFVGVYVVATVLMIPGSALTLVAGAVFGLWIGTAAVSLGSTIGVAMTFLIGRYLARDRVAGMVKDYPLFRAVDGALGQGGWKVVALLRLSPVIPFNVQNYFYGLTSIRFWPTVLASWVAMLPGTFMYVYLGYAGREVAGAVGDGGEAGLWELTLKGAGLIATVIVTVYITRLSVRAVRSYTEESGYIEETDMDKNTQSGTKRRGRWGVIVMAGVAVVVLGGGAYARMNPQCIQTLMAKIAGPPAVVSTEVYDEPAGEAAMVFDHSVFDAVLKKYVDADGWVDYKALADDAEPLDAYIASLAKAPFDRFGRDEKLAYLINAYNAFTLRLILDYYPVKSIKDIPSAKRWDAERWVLPAGVDGGVAKEGGAYSLNQIEHKLIRPKFKEPRIHFALVCAAYSCPKLREEVYTGDGLEAQLTDQMVYAHSHDRWFRFDQAGGTVYLTPLYNWYSGDFEAVGGSVLDYVAGQVPAVGEAVASGRKLKVRWLDYDWKLNDISNAP